MLWSVFQKHNKKSEFYKHKQLLHLNNHEGNKKHWQKETGKGSLFLKSQSLHYRSYDISLKPTRGLVMGSEYICSDLAYHWHASFSMRILWI